MLKKKTKLKLHWKLCERKVWVFIEGKVGRKKLKLYWKCKATLILKQFFFCLNDTHFKTEGVFECDLVTIML